MIPKEALFSRSQSHRDLANYLVLEEPRHKGFSRHDTLTNHLKVDHLRVVHWAAGSVKLTKHSRVVYWPADTALVSGWGEPGDRRYTGDEDGI